MSDRGEQSDMVYTLIYLSKGWVGEVGLMHYPPCRRGLHFPCGSLFNIDLSNITLVAHDLLTNVILFSAHRDNIHRISLH